MFFLIRNQIVIASRKDINFARQFSSVNLVHRMETNIARQFFEVGRFIIAVQENFRDALTNVSRVRLLSIRRRWQIEIPPVSGCRHLRRKRNYVQAKHVSDKSVLVSVKKAAPENSLRSRYNNCLSYRGPGGGVSAGAFFFPRSGCGWLCSAPAGAPPRGCPPGWPGWPWALWPVSLAPRIAPGGPPVGGGLPG